METSSSPVPVANFRESAIAEEPKEAIKEPRQVKAETTQYVDKHQVQQQLGLFAAKRPKGVIFTMHHQVNNPQANPNHQQEGYELKDTNPQLGERWPNGGGYGRRWWMSGESSITGGCDLYAEVKLGNYKGRMKHFEKKMNPEWKQIRSKVYVSPKLWYLRLNVIEAQDIVPNDKIHMPEGPSASLKRRCVGEDKSTTQHFEKWLDHRPVHSSQCNLEKFGFGSLEADRRNSSSSQAVGILEVGILGAQGLLPMKMKDGRGTTDACVVASDLNEHRFGDVCHCKNPVTLVLVHILFLILIWYTELILPTLFLCMFLIGLWNYRDTKGEVSLTAGLERPESNQPLHSVLSLCSSGALRDLFKVVALVAGLCMLRHPSAL
ncbi:calcium-dependent lipid-binding (CaLB domain) plant phosphoribosyltransferase family protein [Actinidia rufa]|uniref:Calcium-dependent lipid-binding (CaLB domain) plant phosphoribosyltransferase family protein n=1 Tax=Actinidia rufa TaxID=165716 RepID=A0A7J0DYM3_9ERIC|nr:calcium-dependent lipid-binding (CaLB domain) plant phosphoribosyltransferase family protein [Actinidia rufa]